MNPQVENLLLIPGLLCDRELWRAQIEALSDLAVISVADTTGHSDMKQLAASILDRAPSEFALAGFSMGGYCALEICQQAPERVQKLALIDTSARADTAEKIEHRQALIKLCRAEKLDPVMDRLLREFIHPSRFNDKILVRKIREMASRIGCENFIAQQEAIMGREDKRAMLQKITCETLILFGAQDRLILPELHFELAREIPDARLVEVDHSGHFTPMEQADQVSTAMASWLSYEPGSSAKVS